MLQECIISTKQVTKSTFLSYYWVYMASLEVENIENCFQECNDLSTDKHMGQQQ